MLEPDAPATTAKHPCAWAASISFGIHGEHYRLAPRHRFPTGGHSGAHASRNRRVIELETTALQALQESLGRRELHPCFAFGVALEKGNRHSLPTIVIRLMRFTLEVPIIQGAIDIDGAAVVSGFRHEAGSSMPARPKHRFRGGRGYGSGLRTFEVESVAADPHVVRSSIPRSRARPIGSPIVS